MHITPYFILFIYHDLWIHPLYLFPRENTLDAFTQQYELKSTNKKEKLLQRVPYLLIHFQNAKSKCSRHFPRKLFPLRYSRNARSHLSYRTIFHFDVGKARGKAAIHEENSTKRFLSNRGTVDDFQPQSRLKPLALSVDSQDGGISRIHIGVVGFL